MNMNTTFLRKIEMNTIVKNVLEKYLDENQKIKLPDWCKRVNIDVGTSINAPYSEIWLKEDPELCVFAFEPNPYNIEFLKTGGNIWPIHLDPERINKSFFVSECALSNGKARKSKFYCTDGDSGTSSLFEPTKIPVKEVVDVSLITLKNFFDLFPWGSINTIHHLKIDAQSSDFNIIKGCSTYLKDKVLEVTVETDTGDHYNNNENPVEMKNYIENMGFKCNSWGGGDGNFTNLNL